MSFSDELKADEVYKKYRNILTLVKAAVDPEKTKAEAITLHKLRGSRELTREKMSPTKLHDAITKDLSTRARLIELRINLYVQSDILSTAMRKLKDHVLSKYRDEMKELTSNAEERNALLRRCTAGGQDFMDLLKGSMDVIDMVTTDIDKAGYAMTNAKDLIRIVIERPGQVV